MGLELEIRASDSPRHFFFFLKQRLSGFFFFQGSISFCSLFNFFFKFVDYLFLVLLDFRCYSWTSSSFGEQDCSLVMVSGLLIAWASLVGGEQALGMWAQ